METITVSNIKIDVVKKNIKNLHLAVYPPTGRVRIAAPEQTNDEAIRLFAVSKLGWIKRHQRTFETQDRETTREFVSGESHYFNGKRYFLKVIEHDATPKVELHHRKIELYVRPNSTTKQRATVLNDWFRERLKKQIPELIEKWEKKINVKLNGWQVKQMKTKWGTCNIEAKRIWLNLELAKKPKRCLEYIIVHEMIHLLERHHNDNFVAYMDKFLPQWKLCKKELNNLPVSHAEWK
ncbi:MAG: M48 family metallopeptidase [Chitinophagaceae bacterium]|jgi:predicted metal-dependent hydrolase|nr:M48 family metallopeptidase [Chitinophagaceae bacterium]